MSNGALVKETGTFPPIPEGKTAQNTLNYLCADLWNARKEVRPSWVNTAKTAGVTGLVLWFTNKLWQKGLISTPSPIPAVGDERGTVMIRRLYPKDEMVTILDRMEELTGSSRRAEKRPFTQLGLTSSVIQLARKNMFPEKETV